MKTKLFILILIFASYLQAQNVIIVVIDGARYSETFGGSSEYIPHLYHDLAPSGAIFTNFRIADEGITSTNPGQASILTGMWQLIANDGSERPKQPTVFEYYRKEYSTDSTDCFIVAGKQKIHALSYSTFPGYGSEFGASTNCFEGEDDAVYDSLVITMDTYQPKLILVNFPTTDRMGHIGVRDDYLKALKNADSLVFKLWQKIQDDPYYKNTTTMVVTNDHGRHTNDFKDHGCNCDGCEHIMLLAVGKNVEPGVENTDLHYQIDIGPTVGDLLGFSTPQATGTSLYNELNPLPVELTTFSAVIIKNSVKLVWRLAMEMSTCGFEIQSASSSISPLQGWKTIGFVKGNGGSNREYFFVDDFTFCHTSTSTFRYRLKQINSDGRIGYSGVINVNPNSQEK